jgi:membrane associated rhomboid family serine protease
MLKRMGSDIESYCGFFPILGIYWLSGLSGQLASSVFNPNIVGVGASGAIYGFLGLLFGDFIQNHKTLGEGKWIYFASLMANFLIGFSIGLLPIIDNWYAHFTSSLFLLLT